MKRVVDIIQEKLIQDEYIRDALKQHSLKFSKTLSVKNNRVSFQQRIYECDCGFTFRLVLGSSNDNEKKHLSYIFQSDKLNSHN